jgi:Protein of unknown function (DUF559)
VVRPQCPKARSLFRRQLSVAGRFIVDFCAPSVMLIIELEGAIHARKRYSDARRDRMFQRAGFQVLRISVRLVGGVGGGQQQPSPTATGRHSGLSSPLRLATDKPKSPPPGPSPSPAPPLSTPGEPSVPAPASTSLRAAKRGLETDNPFR